MTHFFRVMCLFFLTSACVSERPKAPIGLGSFVVEVVSMGPFIKPGGCSAVSDFGTRDCPRPFPTSAAPTSVHLRITALDRQRNTDTEYNGRAQVDVRPGALSGVGPSGVTASFTNGVSEVDVDLAYTFGATRVWVEECGSSVEPGSYATGVSPEIWFALPTLDAINSTEDNSTSPMIPNVTNVCAVIGDPRYGVFYDSTTDTESYVGFSHGHAVNAPPPAIGNYIEVVGCSRADYDAADCDSGPLLVTGIGNSGFYVTDISSAATTAGFNHLFAFNFNYPDDLEVGDFLLSLRGSPVEFTGTTQLANPSWLRDLDGRSTDLLPTPVHISAATYTTAVKTYGRNTSPGDAGHLVLEKLEGALVCMDNLAPSGGSRNCDANGSGSMERDGCLLDFGADLPISCTLGTELVAAPPLCTEASRRPFCMPAEVDVTACGLTGYVPANPIEYCCERECYNDFNCTDSAALTQYGQWVADVNGNYAVPDGAPDTKPVKVAIISRDADPNFDALAFSAEQQQVAADERKHVRVIGNLRQVLAARPVWVIVARTPADIAVDEVCP